MQRLKGEVILNLAPLRILLSHQLRVPWTLGPLEPPSVLNLAESINDEYDKHS